MAEEDAFTTAFDRPSANSASAAKVRLAEFAKTIWIAPSRQTPTATSVNRGRRARIPLRVRLDRRRPAAKELMGVPHAAAPPPSATQTPVGTVIRHRPARRNCG